MRFLTYKGQNVKTNIGAFVVSSAPVFNDLKFTILTATDNMPVRLPTPVDNQATSRHDEKTYSYNYVVDWGDGSPVSDSITTVDDLAAEHNYVTAGEYIITITGVCEAIVTNLDLLLPNAGASIGSHDNFFDSLTDINSWGDTGLLTIAFNGCTNLKTLPTDGSRLFDIDSFESTFSSCTSLESIPPTLFEDSINVTSFTDTFNSCASLTTIPAGLFDNNVNVTSFTDTFNSCASLTTIPAGLFDNNVNASEFNGTFSNCTSLATIPSDIITLVNNPLASNFERTFKFAFNFFGDLPELWNEGFSVTNSLDCFYACNNAINYASVPGYWAAGPVTGPVTT